MTETPKDVARFLLFFAAMVALIVTWAAFVRVDCVQ